MKLVCPNSSSHKVFIRQSHDYQGTKVNVELVDEYGRFLGDPLDLYTGNVTYDYICADCGAAAKEMD